MGTTETIATLTTKTLGDVVTKYRYDIEWMDAPALSDDADDPIIVDDHGDLLDGFHRVAGYSAALQADPDLADVKVRVVVVHDADLASDCAEPGGCQEEAIAAVYEAAEVMRPW